MAKSISTSAVRFFLVANLLVLGTLLYAFVLESANPDLYYLSVQEDEYLEWATFWAFVIAAIAYLRSATDYRRASGRFPWFQYGVALFCVLVAMEEISWAQRLFAYRPPVYFLENNFQQEFNVHNVVDTTYRQIALTLIIVGYGIVLPIVARIKALNPLLRRLGIVAPPIALLPSFAAALWLFVDYPLSFSGEWVELMLGLSFLFSALPPSVRLQPASVSLAVFVVVAGLGVATGTASRVLRSAHPETMEIAAIEATAIAKDFDSGLADSRCNLHKRLYTFVEEYRQHNLLTGTFAALQSQGLPEERADYFLDPWNSPYWVRDRCNRQTRDRVRFVYSFGPNRRRDSSRTEILGDDIGAYIHAR